jgi:hypothetical protein
LERQVLVGGTEGVMVLTLKLPSMVTAVPDSLRSESARVLLPVNLAMRPAVPPVVLTPLAAVKQFEALAVVQTS